jgi:hypothetical protein
LALFGVRAVEPEEVARGARLDPLLVQEHELALALLLFVSFGAFRTLKNSLHFLVITMPKFQSIRRLRHRFVPSTALGVPLRGTHVPIPPLIQLRNDSTLAQILVFA